MEVKIKWIDVLKLVAVKKQTRGDQGFELFSIFFLSFLLTVVNLDQFTGAEQRQH